MIKVTEGNEISELFWILPTQNSMEVEETLHCMAEAGVIRHFMFQLE